jgi:hypothetical protein
MKFLNRYSVTLLIICLLALVYESVVQHNKDLDIFIGASRLIFEGKSCYEVWIPSGTGALKYFYSPLFAVILAPLKDMPQVACNLIWLSLSFVIIYRTFWLFNYFLPLNNFPDKKKRLFYFLCIACCARYILDNLALGQMTFMMVWGSLEVIRLVSLKKYVWASALLALIINFKIIPIAILAYLIYKKEFRAVILTCVFSIICLFLPVIFLGYDFNNSLLHSWLGSLTGTASNSIYDDIGRPSLSSLIPSLVMDSEMQFSLKRNFLHLNGSGTNMVLNGIRAVFLIFLVYLFGKPFKKAAAKKSVFYDLSLICIATPLLFPHQGKYSVYYLLPAYAYCIYSLIKLHAVRNRVKCKKIYNYTLIFLCFSFSFVTLTTDSVIGRRLSDFTEYLHFITYGSLGLLIAMVFLKPRQSLWKSLIERRFYDA